MDYQIEQLLNFGLELFGRFGHNWCVSFGGMEYDSINIIITQLVFKGGEDVKCKFSTLRWHHT